MATIQRSIAEVAPATEPITLEEAKKALDIASGVDDHDAEVRRHIQSARQKWERDTQRLTVSRTVVENLDTFPDLDWRFYYRPVVSVTSVKYYDTSNAQQTESSATYSLDAPNRILHLAVDQSWPSHETRWDAVEVTYVAGESLPLEVTKHAMILLIKLYFSDLDESATKKHERAYHHLMLNYSRPSYP